MYKAIIVDDEHWIVEGLKAGVQWEAYGTEVTGTAGNGEEALVLIEKLKPEIVFTDIKMPVMNGLELIKKGRELSPGTLFIVLSGHAEFAYAQKALNYGTFGYCLKPFELDEIHAMLHRVTQELSGRKQNNSASAAADLYEAICSGLESRVHALIAAAGFHLNASSSMIPVVVHCQSRPLLSREETCLEFPMSTKRHGYLINVEQVDSFLEQLRCAIGNTEYSIGIGPSITAVEQLDASLESASIAAYGRFTTGQSGVYHHSSAPGPQTETMLKDISAAFQRKDRVHFVGSIDSIRAGFHDGRYTIKEAYLLFTTVMCLFYKEGSTSYGRLFEGYEQLYYQFHHADAMLDYLLEHTLHYFSASSAAREPKVSHHTIKEMLAYIHDHFTKDLSVQGLSDQFFLSPNYLCHLFKKEVGENLIEYISKLRIDYACKLLTETEQPIHQIGDKCGFNDYYYFTRIFKRMTQMTPTQYRERMIHT